MGDKKNRIKTNRNFIMRFGKANISMLIALVGVIVFFSVSSPNFLTANNGFNVLRQISSNAIIAIGMTFVLLIGGIDLSVGSVIAATNCISISLMVSGVPIWLAVIAGILLGSLIGLVNGFVIAKLRIPAFIMTLAMMQIARGVAYVYTDGKPVRFDNDTLSLIGNGYIGWVPVPVIIMIFCLTLFILLLHRTKFGSHVYAVGGNREAAKFSGIPIIRIEILVYTICGTLAGVSGIILSSRMLSAQPTSGSGAEMDAIAAVVLGGTSLSGGVGTIAGTLIGALFIGVLNNGLNILGVSSYWQEIIKGIVIITAVMVDVIKNKQFKK